MSILIATYFLFGNSACFTTQFLLGTLINPCLKDMASLNVVKAAMNSRDTVKNRMRIKGKTLT